MRRDNQGHVFLNLEGEAPENVPFLKNGHGYHAYVSTKNDFIHQLFKNLSIWNGTTAVYEAPDGKYYYEYELSCTDRKFFYSETFKKFCNSNDIELTIFDSSSDKEIIIGFFRDQRIIMKR